MAKKKSFIKKLDISAENVPTFQTDRELYEYLFIKEILKLPYPQKITDKATLVDFVPKEHRGNKEFVEAYLQMYQDMAIIKFGQSIYREKNKPVKEIIDFLCKRRSWGRK